MISWVKQLKRDSRSILFGNYGIFLFATLFFAAISFGTVLISKSFCELLCLAVSASDNVYYMVNTTADLLCIIIFFPFFCGYLSVFSDICCGRHCELPVLFRFYSSRKNFAKCFEFMLKLTPQVLIRIILPAVLLFAISMYVPQITQDILKADSAAAQNLIAALMFVLQVILIICIFYLSGSPLLSIIGFCLGISKRYSTADRHRFFTLRMSLLPLYIFSVLTFGLLFLCYTFPMTAVLYSRFVCTVTLKDEEKAADSRHDTRVFDIPPKHGNTNQNN